MTMPLESRGVYGWAGAVLAGLISATLFSVALKHMDSLIFFIIYATAIPLFVAGLGAGPFAGVLAAIAGFVDLLVRGPSNHAVLYAFIYAMPALIFTALALRYRMGPDMKTYWYPEGHLLTALVLYPCILFLIASAVASGHEGGLLALTREYFGSSVKKGTDIETADQILATFNLIARYAPAIAGLAWSFLTMMSMAVGQNALQQHQWNLRSSFTLRDLHMPHWLINAVAVTGLVGVVAPDPYGYIGVNLAIMMGLPFLFVGLAVIHAWAGTKKGTTFILIVFYFVLVLMSFLLLLVALLGVVDQWVNFRQRFTKQTKTT